MIGGLLHAKNGISGLCTVVLCPTVVEGECVAEPRLFLVEASTRTLLANREKSRRKLFLPALSRLLPADHEESRRGAAIRRPIGKSPGAEPQSAGRSGRVPARSRILSADREESRRGAAFCRPIKVKSGRSGEILSEILSRSVISDRARRVHLTLGLLFEFAVSRENDTSTTAKYPSRRGNPLSRQKNPSGERETNLLGQLGKR